MLLNIDDPKINTQEPKAKTLADAWILERLSMVVGKTSENIEKFNFSMAGEELRDFTWSDLADWYLEIAKVEGGKSEVLNYILNTMLKLWQPFMPFVTETIWQEVYGNDKLVMVEKWPVTTRKSLPESNDFEIIKSIITGIRSLRAENKIEPAKKIGAYLNIGNRKDLIKENEEVVKIMARLEKLEFVESGAEIALDLAGAVDVEKERPRLQKEIAEITKYISGLENKLSNQEFVNNAPPVVVEKEQAKLSEAKIKLEKLQQQFENLK
jgi:valyl-tRNA synthetase